MSAPVQLSAQTAAQTVVPGDDNDIGGRGAGANGPEAGVCVIAETNELPTKYAKMVVTDDLGRYVTRTFRLRTTASVTERQRCLILVARPIASAQLRTN